MIRLLAVALLLIQAGCVYDRMTPEQQASVVRATSEKCTAFGYQPGTTAHSQCIEYSIAESDARKQRAAAQAGANMTAASIAMGNNRSTNCRSYADASGTVRTTCY